MSEPVSLVISDEKSESMLFLELAQILRDLRGIQIIRGEIVWQQTGLGLDGEKVANAAILIKLETEFGR